VPGRTPKVRPDTPLDVATLPKATAIRLGFFQLARKKVSRGARLRRPPSKKTWFFAGCSGAKLLAWLSLTPVV